MATPIPANSSPFTLGEIARAASGKIVRGSESLPIRGVSIDSRTIPSGALFVAIRGAVHDGHAYLAAASDRGAGALLIERDADSVSIPAIEVADTLDALGALAHFHLARERSARALPVAAVLGSAGKTTTKEIVAALVGALFGSTLSTPGNLNNLIGVPMTLFTLTREHRALVIECGTNTPGEIARLGAIVQPDVALMLNVDVEHSQGLGTIEEIANEETSIFRSTAKTAVVPAGDSKIIARVPAKLAMINFGQSPEADVRLARRSATSRGRSRVEIALAPPLVKSGTSPRIEAELQLLGAQSALNATAAVATAAALFAKPLGASQVASMAEALGKVRPVPGRLSAETIARIFVLDDTYNSNPRSAHAALETAAEVAHDLGGRLVIAMGDMLELGSLSSSAHLELIREIERAAPAEFIAVGSELAAACRAIADSGSRFANRAVLATDSGEAARLIRPLLHSGDVLLVKGSRGIRMERIIEDLRGA